ncbi:MAG: 5-oxoprolinase subunit C family protein [Burkholderiales bacterium]
MRAGSGVMQALEVIAPGLHTTLQDRGRVGFQDVGVPASGPLDRVSLRLANALVGNPAGTPAFEMLLQGPTLKVNADCVRVALVGCSASIEVRSENPRRIPPGESATLVRGDVLRVGALGDSVCAYLAIEGGPDVAQVLGSASTYVRGGIGGFKGRRLQQHDTVPLKRGRVDARRERALPGPLDLALDQTIRVVLGPQADYFTEAAVQTFLSSEFRISPQADRMGYRLEGPALAHAKGYNIVSDGIVTGSVQVPGSGQPIVLMVDNQTTGGYPKIATVISADIPVIARRKPGRTIRFVAVDVRQAQMLRKQQEAAVEQQEKAIRAVQ